MNNDKIVKFNAFRILCIKNAEDSIKAAEILLDRNLNHIVFHLSLLGLEEVGKIFMTWIKINQAENWDKESSKLEIDNHVKKLFYAIWGPSIGKEIIDKNQWAENQLMATKLHSLRLFYLYGAIEDTTESSKKILSEEAQGIYEFAKSRLELARVEGEIKEDFNSKESFDGQWFDNFLKIDGKEELVFGKIGQEKLIELKDVNKWIKWLKENYEKEKRELSQLTNNEIERKIDKSLEAMKPKWEFSLTIATPSHSLRNKDLSAINKFEKPFKFFLGKDRHSLIIKHKLPSIVSVNDLWSQGWLTSKLFVAALNIASRGLFYWHTPKDIDKYYDSLLDLESNKKLTVSLYPQLALNWQERKMYLSLEQLHLTFMVYEYFISVDKMKIRNIVMEYMSALAMYARTDIHLRMEVNSFMLFFKVFQQLLIKNEVIKNDDELFEIGLSQIVGMLKGRDEYDKNIKLVQAVLTQKKLEEPITLREVVAMKNYCDIYLLTIAFRIMHNEPGACLTGDNSETPKEEIS